MPGLHVDMFILEFGVANLVSIGMEGAKIAGGEGVKGPQVGNLCYQERATHRVAPTGNGRGKGGRTGPPLRKTQNWELATLTPGHFFL